MRKLYQHIQAERTDAIEIPRKRSEGGSTRRRKDSFLLRLSLSLRERAMNFPFSNLLRNDNYGLLAVTVAGGGSVGALETKSH